MIQDKRRTRYGHGFLESNDSVSPNESSFTAKISSEEPKLQTTPLTELKMDINKIPASLQPLLNIPLTNNGANINDREPLRRAPKSHVKLFKQQKSDRNLLYVGSSSPISFLFLCRGISSEWDLMNLRNTPFVKDVKKFVLQGTTPMIFESDANANLTKFPSRVYAEFLINLFIQNVNQLVYIVNPGYITNTLLEDIYSNTSTTPKAHLCIFYLLLAIGSHFAKALERFIPGSIAFDPTFPPQLFFKKAMTLLQTGDNEPSIWVVEAHFLLLIYQVFSNNSYSLWIKLGTAIRYAESLGLNKLLANNLFEDPAYVLHRKRLWRSLYVADRLLSPLVGRSLSILDAQWDYIYEPLAYNRDFAGECEHQMLKASIINGKGLDAVFCGPDKLDFVKMKEVAMEYRKWSKELPYELNIEAFLQIDKIYDSIAHDGNNTKYAYHPLYFLYLVFSMGNILLTRTCIALLVVRRLQYLNYGNTEGFGPVSSNSFISDFAFSCYNACKFTISLSDFFSEKKSLRPDKPFIFVSATFKAGLIIGMIYYCQVAERNSIYANDDHDLSFLKEDNEKLFLKAISLLEDYSKVDNLSHRYGEILLNLYHSTKSKDKSDPAHHTYQASEEHNVRKGFEKFLFPNIENISTESQETDINTLNEFVNRFVEHRSVMLDGAF